MDKVTLSQAFLQVPIICPFSAIPPVLRTYLRLVTAAILRTRGRSLETFKQSNNLSDIRHKSTDKYFQALFHPSELQLPVWTLNCLQKIIRPIEDSKRYPFSFWFTLPIKAWQTSLSVTPELSKHRTKFYSGHPTVCMTLKPSVTVP